MSESAEIDETRGISASILFILFLLVANELIQTLLSKLKMRYGFFRYFQPTSITTLIGIFAGIFLKYAGFSIILKDIRAGFSDFFLIVLLPPILFESAINMEKKSFFKNFGSILTFAIFGTAFASVITAILIYLAGALGIATELSLLDSLAFGSFISATDPVAVLAIFKEMKDTDPNLYALIFGESILNDAISLIMFFTFDKMKHSSSNPGNFFYSFGWNFFGSLLIGTLTGCICAYFLKTNAKRQQGHHSESLENKEASIMVIIPWVCYLLADGFSMSGIVAIMFCGIAMARYALPNLSENGFKIMKKLYHTLAHNFENAVFLFIGIGFFGFELSFKQMGAMLFICSFLSINLARYLMVYVISGILNFYRVANKITPSFKFVIWFSGFRGAMAYALAIQSSSKFKESGNIMLTITLIYISINIFFYGGLLLPILERTDIQGKEKKQEEAFINQQYFWNRVKNYITNLDENYLQKFLTSKPNTQEEDKNKSKEKNKSASYSPGFEKTDPKKIFENKDVEMDIYHMNLEGTNENNYIKKPLNKK